MRLTCVILTALLCLAARAEAPESDTDEAIVQAAEKLISEGKAEQTKGTASKAESPRAAIEAVMPEDAGKAAEAAANEASAAETPDATAPPAPAAAPSEKKESEIPIFTKSEKVAKSETNLIWRLVASLAVVLFVGGAMIFAARKWKWQRNKGGEKTRIEVLHQYHLGPRKSLALIRVAGETMVIGCTDHAINMIKAVTVIDDDIEGAIEKDFNGFLDDEFSIEDMRSAISARSGAGT